MLPVYYRKLAGYITDVKIMENLIKDIDFLKLDKLKLVMDRDFYSEKNINDLMKHHHKFLIGAKLSMSKVSDRLDKIRADFVTCYNYNSELKLYVMSFTKIGSIQKKRSAAEKLSQTKTHLSPLLLQ